MVFSLERHLPATLLLLVFTHLSLAFRLKTLYKRIAFPALDRWVLASVRPEGGNEKAVLVLKLDVLGDYLLTRLFLKTISRAYGSAPIILVINRVNYDLADWLDGDWVQEIIPVDSRGKLLSSAGYRRDVLTAIREKGPFHAVIHPTAKRLIFTESLVRVVDAREKIGYAPQAMFSRDTFEQQSDAWYTRLIPVQNPGLFEFESQQSFFGQAFNEDLSGLRVFDPAIKQRAMGIVPKEAQGLDYILLSPGAGFVVKQWQPERFVELANRLQNETSARIVLTGGPGDAEACRQVEAGLPGCLNLCSKIALPEVMGLVAGARMLVTNDSAPQHMAAMVGTPTVCLTGANHYGWWHPYPNTLAPWIFTVYPREISESGFSHEYLCELYGPGSSITVHGVDVEDAYEACRRALGVERPS